VMNSNGMASAPLLVTEGGFGYDNNSGAGSYGCAANVNNLTACLTAAQQVAYVGRWLILSASTWADGSGQLANWYGYNFDWGTLNGAYGMNPQNAAAYGQVEGWIKGGSFEQPCMVVATLYVCEFRNAAGSKRQIVFNDNKGATVNYAAPAWAKSFTPLLGSLTSMSGGGVAVGDSPILLQ